MNERLDKVWADWQELAKIRPIAARFLPWAESLLAAARESAVCGLDRQAELLLARIQARADSIGTAPFESDKEVRLEAVWNPKGLPPPANPQRQARVWRKIRSLRSARLPFQGEHHPAAMGLAWGPYNQQSAVAEALKAAASVDPLWVDDFLEREKAMRALDGLLGMK